uniref:Calponin-homology (CH) domain-containing protein n=1 Tax=Ascaris lumbricoides TaxID=6252 RepID=A0A0M3IBZ6_ASCLU
MSLNSADEDPTNDPSRRKGTRSERQTLPREMSLNSADEDPTNDYMSAGLQPDAQWKKIQQNTFTRWVNQHLKHVNVVVDDLVS